MWLVLGRGVSPDPKNLPPGGLSRSWLRDSVLLLTGPLLTGPLSGLACVIGVPGEILV